MEALTGEGSSSEGVVCFTLSLWEEAANQVRNRGSSRKGSRFRLGAGKELEAERAEKGQRARGEWRELGAVPLGVRHRAVSSPKLAGPLEGSRSMRQSGGTFEITLAAAWS